MAIAYATEEELDGFLAAGVTVTDGPRLLARATELLDGIVRTPYRLTDDGLPDDTVYAEALRDAVCAQVEFWLEVGEENDIDGLAGTDVSVSGYSGRRPPRVAPRAARILGGAGLISPSIDTASVERVVYG